MSETITRYQEMLDEVRKIRKERDDLKQTVEGDKAAFKRARCFLCIMSSVITVLTALLIWRW